MSLPPDEREKRLRPVIEAYRNTAFTWGLHDCALFAARCVDAQIGTRFESNIQRDYAYEGPVSAVRLVKEAGGWETIIGRYMGASVSPEDLEILGDVVLARAHAPFERTALLGIRDEELIVVPGTLKLEWLPMSHAICGWKLDNVRTGWFDV